MRNKQWFAKRSSLIVALLFMSLGAAQAATSTASSTAATTAKKVVSKKASRNAGVNKKLSRDVRFNGSQVNGKYLSAGESIAEVEGDKDMGALIGIRKNFHDRLSAEKNRLQAAGSGKGN